MQKIKKGTKVKFVWYACENASGIEKEGKVFVDLQDKIAVKTNEPTGEKNCLGGLLYKIYCVDKKDILKIR